MTLFAALFTALFIARVSAQQPGQIGRGGVPAWANPDFVACGSPSDTCGPFFAEAAEGSSNNKYLEIYNPTNESLDRARAPCAAWPALRSPDVAPGCTVSEFAFPNAANEITSSGSYEFWNTFPEGATIAPGALFVICHPAADPQIQLFCDTHHQHLSNG